MTDAPPDQVAPTKDDAPKTAADDGKESPAYCRAAVKQWQQRVKDAKKHWDSDFKRIRTDQKFAFGLQWAEQSDLHDDRYVANITLRHLREKEAALYARNPTAEFKRRKRLDYQLWDGDPAKLMQAHGAVGQALLLRMPPPPPAVALLMDFSQGQSKQQVIDKVGKTLEIAYQYFVDEQEPDFKEQMKGAVLRALTGGVAWVRLGFEREFTSSLASYDTASAFGDRTKRLTRILERMQEDKVPEDDPDMQAVRDLITSLLHGAADGETQDVDERLVFDFPMSTAVIVDPKCRCLKTFDGARWIAQEYILPLEEVNEYFEKDISPISSEIAHYTDDGTCIESAPDGTKVKDPMKTPMVCVWEVFDHRTKSVFFIADGYKDYIQEPGPVEPTTRRFWPLYGLVFNKVIIDPGQKGSIYPPSDVTLMRHAQKEWNRCREELRDHRKANAPKYLTRAGWLTEEDKNRIKNSPPSAVIELTGLPANEIPNKAFGPMAHDPLQPQLYDTNPLEQDFQLVNGAQQADLGAPKGDVTATASSIAEHAKMSTTSDNVDDLDGLLDALARSSGEVMLRELSPQTVKRIVGPGALFPEGPEREDFINEIALQAKAASSGRPNKALEVSNWQILAPLLLQAGANPQGIIKETARRLDDQMDVQQFFPLALPAPPPGGGGGRPNPAPGRRPPPPNGAKPPGRTLNGPAGPAARPGPAPALPVGGA